MPLSQNEKVLSSDEIKKLLTDHMAVANLCGFETYVITEDEPRLKKINFVEEKDNNLRRKLKYSILEIIKEKYCSAEAEYVSADRIADEQRKFYIISTDENYNPFSVLDTEPGCFRKKDMSGTTGIAFCISKNGRNIWAYQHLWPIMVPNKSGKNTLARMISGKEGDAFEELQEPLLTFADRVDFLIVESHIIASDYKLLQKSFGFQDYIRIRANRTIEAVKATGIVSNIEKLEGYVERGNGKTKYAKKMMRIAESKVLSMDKETLWNNIHESARWNGKIKEESGKFVLDTYTQVELLIDLLDERFTRSDITGEEYDTAVKQLAEPAEG